MGKIDFIDRSIPEKLFFAAGYLISQMLAKKIKKPVQHLLR